MPREKIAVNSSNQSSRFPARPLETLGAARVITLAELDQFQSFAFDPGGAGRNVDLPAEEACAGSLVFVSNEADAAEVLTIRNDAGGTIVTPTQNEAAVLWCNGTAWFGLVGASS